MFPFAFSPGPKFPAALGRDTSVKILCVYHRRFWFESRKRESVQPSHHPQEFKDWRGAKAGSFNLKLKRPRPINPRHFDNLRASARR